MAKIGFIGMGNMGYAMLKGALQIVQKEDLVFTDVNQERRTAVAKETEVVAVETNLQCIQSSKYVIMAVKPQFYPEVIEDLKKCLTKEQVVISIAPGITIGSLKEQLGEEMRIVRAMPNTAALLGEAMTGISYEKEKFSAEEEQVIVQFFDSFGKVEIVPEHLMSAVVCASGSSPAYVYLFIEALADSIVKYGMPRDKAYSFAAQAVKGAAEMALVTGKHPGELKDQVCSPGGTTIAGVAKLEEFGFRNAIIQATDACYNKAEGFK